MNTVAKNDYQSLLSQGLAHHRAGRFDEAQKYYEEVLRLAPEQADAWHFLGVIADQMGEHGRAVELIGRAIAIRPDDAEAHNNLGMAFKGVGEPQKALGSFERAVAIKPDYPEAWYCVGWMQKDLGNYDAALAAYEKALALAPQFTEARFNLGLLYVALEDYDKAEQAFLGVIAQQPQKAEGYYNLGVVYQGQGRVAEARAALSTGLAIAPNPRVEMFKGLLVSPVPSSVEEIETCRKAFHRFLSEAPSLDHKETEYANTNFYFSYHGRDNLSLQEGLAKLYLRGDPELGWTAPHCLAPQALAGRKIRLGILSSYLFDAHTIGKLMRGIVEHLPKEQFEIFLYLAAGRAAGASDKIQAAADHAQQLPKDLKAARERVAAAELDILFYPDIGMESFTYFLAFARLAPVQCVGWGHPDTTGIPNLDYFISSRLIEPQGAQKHYSEKLVCLERLPVYYYRPAAGASRSCTEYGLEDAPVYLCPQTLFKLHPEFDEILAAILREDAKAQIVLLEGMHRHWTVLLKERFARTLGNLAPRIRFLPQMGHADFLGLMQASDVMLDPIHFGGGNTTFEAFGLGMPIVTWPGEYMRGRVTHGCYQAMGIDDLVARDHSHYAELAVRVANDAKWRESIKVRIAERSAVLFERQDSVQEMAEFFAAAVIKGL